MSIYNKRYTLSNGWQIMRSEITSALSLVSQAGISYTSIPFAPKGLVEDAKGVGNYIHWGRITVEIVTLYRGEDKEALLVIHDDRWKNVNERMIKMERFQLTNGNNILHFQPDFIVAVGDEGAMSSLKMSLFIINLEFMPGSMPLAVKSSGLFKVIKNLTEDVSYRKRDFSIPENTEDFASLMEDFPEHAFALVEETKLDFSHIWPRRVHRAEVTSTGTVEPKVEEVRSLRQSNRDNSRIAEFLRGIPDDDARSTRSTATNPTARTNSRDPDTTGDTTEQRNQRQASAIRGSFFGQGALEPNRNHPTTGDDRSQSELASLRRARGGA